MEFKSDQAKTWLEDENGKKIALLDHPEVRPGVVNIVHTEVDPSLGGQGIAGKITQAVAEELREKGTRNMRMYWQIRIKKNKRRICWLVLRVG